MPPPLALGGWREMEDGGGLFFHPSHSPGFHTFSYFLTRAGGAYCRKRRIGERKDGEGGRGLCQVRN